jgi:hypothetical protein
MQEDWTFNEELMTKNVTGYDEGREDALADYAIQQKLDEEQDNA